MDSSSSPSHNDNSWLAFSLSNNPHLHLSLFEAFSSPNSASVVDSAIVATPTTDQLHVSPAATELAMFTGGPKLEDFLGGGGGGGVGQTTPISMSSDHPIYESDLKTIAASFLRGYNDNNSSTIMTAAAVSETSVTIDVPAETSPTAAKKAVDTFGQRTSIYRGVTRHRWTGRYEAHLWDNSCRREGQSRKGRQVYLGGYDKEEKAARAYDLAALKYWGSTTTTNLPVSNYEKELEEMKNMTRQEFVASLRRKSSGFSRGASMYRGVTRHHQHGRWQARIGRVAGNKDLYLGTFSTQEEAAEAYDIAAIKFRGLNAVTNFDMGRYDVKSIASSNLPVGGMSNSTKTTKSSDVTANDDAKNNIVGCVVATNDDNSVASTLNFAIPMIKQDPSAPDYWSNIFGYQNPNNNNISINPSGVVTVAKNNNSSSVAFNMDFSSTATTISHDVSNVGGFFGYSNNSHIHQQQQSGGTSCTNTVPFGMPTVNSISNNNNATTYENGIIGWNSNTNIGQTLHSFHHHQPHAKPSTLFQTPIFGME